MPTSSIIIIVVVFVAGLLSGALFITWMLRRSKSAQKTEKPPVRPEAQAKTEGLVFRLSYVILPLLLCAASLVTSAVFAVYLPSRLGFRFDSNGLPLVFMGKYTFVIIMMTGQVLCAAAAWAFAEIVIRMGRSAQQSKLGGVVFLMCNMVLLPQVILAYIMLDGFIYGIWARHLVSVGIFSIFTLALGTLVIVATFVRVLSGPRGPVNRR